MRSMQETRQPMRRPNQATTTQEAARPQIPNSALLDGINSETVLEHLPSTRRDVPEHLRDKLQERFGVPLHGIKVFEDEHLGELGQSAYARGNEIHMAKGGFRTDTAAGQALFMHEAGHIVQQGAGIARGSGILESGNLEQQADTGFSAPASFAMPTTATGMPIQGGERWDKFKKFVKGLPEQIPEKWDELKTFAKSVPEKVKDGATNLGKEVGAGVANTVESFKRKSDRATDNFAEHRADYDKMSRWDRFKFTVANPLTRIRGGIEGKGFDYYRRKSHSNEIDTMAELLREDNKGYADGALGDAGFKAMDTLGAGRTTSAPAQARRSDGQWTGFSGVGGTMKSAALGGAPKTLIGLGGTGVGMLGTSPGDVAKDISAATNSRTGAYTEGLAASLSKGDRAAYGIGGGLGGVSSLMGAGANVMSGIDNLKKGNRGEAAANAFETIGNLLGAGSGFGKMDAASKSSKAAVGLAGSTVLPGLSLGQGLAKIGSGGIRTGVGAHGMRKMKGRLNEMGEETDSMSTEDRKKRRTIEQFGKVAKRDTVGGAMELGSGILKTTSAGLSLGGLAPAGTAVGFLGTGVDLIKDLVTGKMDKSMRTSTVNQEIGLDKRIEEFRKNNPRYTAKDAKHIVLKSMGFSTGKRKEAFQNISMNRANTMVESANSGDEESAKILEEIGLSRVEGKYNIQGVAEKLGMDRGKGWEQQMQETIDSRANKNAFAEANKKREEKEKVKADKKTARKQKVQGLWGSVKSFFSRGG